MEDFVKIILDTTDRIFSDWYEAKGEPEGLVTPVPESLWQTVEEAGLPLVWVSEDAGGVGCSLDVGFSVIKAAANYAAPIPLAETLVANWLVMSAELEVSGERSSFDLNESNSVTLTAEGKLQGQARYVPFASEVMHLAVVVEQGQQLKLAVVASTNCRIAEGKSLAGEGRDQLIFNDVTPLELADLPEALTAQKLKAFVALVRAQQVVGSLEKVLSLSTNYVQERVQFGRPLSKFQAVQHMIAEVAGEVVLANAAVGQAVDELSADGQISDQHLLNVATAKIASAVAASKASRIAHQAHGAMGFSLEYPLHEFTRRAWCWSDEYGSETWWSTWLGHHLAKQPESLWVSATSA